MKVNIILQESRIDYTLSYIEMLKNGNSCPEILALCFLLACFRDQILDIGFRLLIGPFSNMLVADVSLFVD